MKRYTVAGARLAAIVALLVWASATPMFAEPGPDVTIASGTLVHHRLTNALFHVEDLWMRVDPDTVFHRWLMEGVDGDASIILTTDPRRFEDVRGARILSGTLVHAIAPTTSPFVHMFYLRDHALGTLGPILFETKQLDVAVRFDGYDGSDVSLVLLVAAPDHTRR